MSSSGPLCPCNCEPWSSAGEKDVEFEQLPKASNSTGARPVGDRKVGHCPCASMERYRRHHLVAMGRPHRKPMPGEAVAVGFRARSIARWRRMVGGAAIEDIAAFEVPRYDAAAERTWGNLVVPVDESGSPRTGCESYQSRISSQRSGASATLSDVVTDLELVLHYRM